MNKQLMVLLAAVTTAAAVHAQTSSPITREGRYWVQTVTEEFAAPGAVRLRVDARGPVTLRGEAGSQVRYNLRKRVRASSEAEARGIFDAIEARFRQQGGIAEIEMRMPPGNLPSPELEVVCPRDLRHCLVSTPGGTLALHSMTGDVEASTGGGPIHADQIGGMVVVRTGGGDIRIGTVGGSLRCVTGGGPIHVKRTGGESWFDTGAGEIVVEEAGGPVHASTGGGNIEVLRAAGQVSARTAGGLIKVMEAMGAVIAESAGGGIQVGSARGVRLESVGGGIRLRGVSGEMKVSTAMGSILAELLAGHAIANSYLSTGSGDVTVLIPSNLAVTVQAHNDSPGRVGRIVSDFPEVRVSSPSTPEPGRIVASGAINGGGPVLTIAAANGTIFLRRQK